jgi:hypothetical protein
VLMSLLIGFSRIWAVRVFAFLSMNKCTAFLGVAKSHALTMELQMGNGLVQSFSLTIA